MLICLSAIVTSRKRKLRELFAVATHVDALPNDAFANPDAPAPTSAEWKFLQASDITQYVFFLCNFPISSQGDIHILLDLFGIVPSMDVTRVELARNEEMPCSL